MQLAAAAFPMLVRLGSGGFGSGYSAKLDSDDGKYGAVRIAGRKVGSTKKKLLRYRVHSQEHPVEH